MKNKIKIAVAICLIATVIMSGCTAKPTSSSGTASEQSALENYIAAAKSKLEASSSFASDFYAEVQMGEEEEKTISKAKVEMIQEPLTVGITTEDLFGQNTTSSQTYLEKTDDAINMYMAYDGQWTEMTLEEGNAMKSVGMYDAAKGMSLLLASGENWKQISEKNGIVTITGEVPAQKVYDISEAGYFLKIAGMNGVAQSYYSGVEAVPFELQLKEDGTPISFSVDFAKTLETVMNHVLQELNQDEAEPISVEKYMIKQTISKLGEVKKIEIPAEARDAINYEKEISLIESNTKQQ
ncbi:MAG: hypothetical protein PHG19_12565 [Anaerotignum sp.]|nr:hypothetical protein [Anaerotignum sp.]